MSSTQCFIEDEVFPLFTTFIVSPKDEDILIKHIFSFFTLRLSHLTPMFVIPVIVTFIGKTFSYDDFNIVIHP